VKCIVLSILAALAPTARAATPAAPSPAAPTPSAATRAVRPPPLPPAAASRPVGAKANDPTTNPSIYGSKHDLSTTGPGPIRAVSETDPCIFCHVAHHGEGTGNNRPDPSAAGYVPYSSSTLVAAPPSGTPTGSSRICLSCHDGTIAVGTTRTRTIDMQGGNAAIPVGPTNLGKDFSGTHPYSFNAVDTAGVHAPLAGDPVKLDRSGRLQCTACHDPHRQYVDPQHGMFLQRSTQSSQLCLACHQPGIYQRPSASHGLSIRTVTVAGVVKSSSPSDQTVQTAGCLACHGSHGADGRGRIVRFPVGSGTGPDQVCLDCHDGTVAQKNIGAVLAGKNAWAVHASATFGPTLHDAAEGPSPKVPALPETTVDPAKRHVTCVDCHNPHAAKQQTAVAPFANGMLAGVWGIDRTGAVVNPVNNEYEVCFKCHGPSANQQASLANLAQPNDPLRAVTEVNLLRALDPNTAASFHPVVGVGRSAKVPGLIAPLTPASRIYCGDCHGSDDGSAPKGPHGSNLPHLLARTYVTADNTPESPLAYALCYGCHDRNVLLGLSAGPDITGFPYHGTHVQGNPAAAPPSPPTPCSACHNSHGISAIAASGGDHSHLIDFDVNIVGGARQYTSTSGATGWGSGNCTLSCHGHDHAPSTYQVTGWNAPARMRAVRPALKGLPVRKAR